jgi:hypothetical protein
MGPLLAGLLERLAARGCITQVKAETLKYMQHGYCAFYGA